MGLVKFLHLKKYDKHSFSWVMLTKDVNESIRNNVQSTGQPAALSATLRLQSVFCCSWIRLQSMRSTVTDGGVRKPHLTS